MFVFPWTNLHELNLDWILSKVKTLLEQTEENNEKADYAVETADEAKTIAEQAAQAQIADGAVTTSKLANGAVTSTKLANNAVYSVNIVDGEVGTSDLAEGAVTTSRIFDGAVTGTKIFDGAVNTVKLADGAVTNSKLSSETGLATISGERVDNVFLASLKSLCGIVFFDYSIQVSIPANTTIYTIGTVPNNFIPSRSVEGVITATDGSASITFFVDSSGNIKLRNTTGQAINQTYFSGCFIYLL